MEYIISNQSILSSLSPRALKVYNFLCEKANRITHSSFWRKSKIAAKCFMSESTFARAIRELKKEGLISVVERYEVCGRQRSNEYFILETEEREYMPPIERTRELKDSNLKVFTYINKRCACGSSEYSFPILDIAATVGISRKTAERCVSYLRKNGFISTKAQNRIAITGDNGTAYNSYSISTKTEYKAEKDTVKTNLFKRILGAFIMSCAEDQKCVHKAHGIKCILAVLLKSMPFSSNMTPSLPSLVTPLRTLFKLEVTNKRKNRDVLSKLGGIASENHAGENGGLANFNRATSLLGSISHRFLNIYKRLRKFCE